MLTRRLYNGWATHFAQLAVGIAQQVLMVPVYLHYWHTDTFAAWLTIYSAGSLLSIADCGLQSVALNLFQRARTSVDPNGRTGAVFSRLFSTYLYIVCSLILIVAGALFALSISQASPWSELTKVPGFVFSLVVVLLGSLLQLPSSLSSMLCRANDRAVVPPIFASCAVIVGMLLQWLVLAGGGGLLSVALVHAGTAIGLSAYMMIVYQKLAFPNVRWVLRLRSPTLVLKELKGAAQYGVPATIELMLSYAPILLIGLLVNDAKTIAAWGLVRALMAVVRHAGTQITLPLIAEVGRAHTLRQQSSVTSLLFAGLITVSILTAVSCAGLLSLGSDFFALWTRGRVGWDATLVSLLSLAALAGAPAIVGSLFALYSGSGRALMRSKVAQMAVVAVLCVPATAGFGAHGFAGVLAIGEVVALILIWTNPLAASLSAGRQGAGGLLTYSALAFLAALALGLLVDIAIDGRELIVVLGKIGLWCLLALGGALLLLWRLVWHDVRLAP